MFGILFVFAESVSLSVVETKKLTRSVHVGSDLHRAHQCDGRIAQFFENGIRFLEKFETIIVTVDHFFVSAVIAACARC